MPQTTGLPIQSCLSPSPFIGKPTIIQPPSVLDAYVGQPGVFHCVAVGDPKPSIQWKNGSDVISTGGRLEVFVNGTLKIKGLLKSDDSGFFTCEAENSYGSTSASASLRVNGTVSPCYLIVTGKNYMFLVKLPYCNLHLHSKQVWQIFERVYFLKLNEKY